MDNPIRRLIFAGGAVLFSGITFLGFKKKCSVCNSLWTINKPCISCGTIICGSCGHNQPEVLYKNFLITPSVRLCKEHKKAYEDNIRTFKRGIDTETQVVIYSINYKGKKPELKFKKKIFTREYRNKDDAERELRIIAAKNSCFVILDVEFSKTTMNDGNYIYSVWKASGTI